MTELDSIRAEIAALWAAVQQVNQNQLSLNANVHRLSQRLILQEAALVVEEMETGERDMH